MEIENSCSQEMMTTKIELAVDMKCDKCSTAVTLCLKANKAIQKVAVNLEKQTVIVETALPTHEVVELIRSTGKKALVTGVGAAGSHVVNLGSAVSIMHEGNPSSGVRGIIRIVQSTMQTSVIDGTLDGLSLNSNYRLGIHEFGDISDGCNSCGELFDIQTSRPDPSHLTTTYGDLGDIFSDQSGRSTFRIESERIKVWDIIGRSMIVKSKLIGHSDDWMKLACGIIARSAGLFENVKRICACDGTTIWNENVSVGAGNPKSSQL